MIAFLLNHLVDGTVWLFRLVEALIGGGILAAISYVTGGPRAYKACVDELYEYVENGHFGARFSNYSWADR